MSILSEITDLTGLVHSLFPHATEGRDKWMRCGDAFGDAGTSFRISTESGIWFCLLYTSPSPRDRTRSRMPSSA